MNEIEKKFLVKNVPNLKELSYIEIAQGYLNLNSEPILRVRQWGNKYFLTYKYKNKKSKINSCIEYELPITKSAFLNLLKKVEGNIIYKKRYFIKLNESLIAELDVFEKFLNGLIMVEVEFPDENDAISFIPPKWFGKEVTNDKKYRNSELSQIKDIKEFINE